MRRGTTPTHIFEVDVDLTEAEAIYITYRQVEDVILEKTIEDMTIEPETITLSLSQAETLAFRVPLAVSIQIRAKFPDGTAIASNIIHTDVEAILKGGEI